MMLQLNPPMPVETPKGSALAHILIDYGAEHELLWVCFQDQTGECWTWRNSKIRAQKNITMGRTMQPIPTVQTPPGTSERNWMNCGKVATTWAW